ncbi:MAG: ankyrin repeat domain-containing protein [Vitreoscilla sp.]|nr:ankyrin repeat domain-containing protein [Burkholderiales bacterium]MBP6339136.1 ankyrin repeat domain-containing protein [Vitreoscilla sp.]
MPHSRRHFSLIGLALLGQACSGAELQADASSSVDFFRAVGTDNAWGAKRELERGLSPNTLSEQGQHALFLAIRDDSPRIQDLLWAWPGIDLNLPNKAGETPLMIAALRGNVAVMKKLLASGVPPHKSGWAPIHYAATGPAVEAVALLLGLGVPIDAPSPNGSTPLMMAARYGAEASVELLVARGADLKRRNDKQMSPLEFAQGADRDWMVRKIESLLAKAAGD